MDLSLSAEQSLIKSSVEQFVSDEYGDEQRRTIAESAEGFGRAHWASFAALGWLGLITDEQLGGFGGGAIETMIVMEAFGAGLVPGPFVQSVVVAGTLLSAARAEPHVRLREAALAGASILGVAYAEGGGGYDPGFVTTSARPSGDAFIIGGRKIAVPYGAALDHLIVSVRTGNPCDGRAGISLFAIDARSAGVVRRDYVTYDGRRASDFAFDGVCVPSTALIGPIDDGLPLLERAIDRGSAAVCAEAVGAMDVLLRSTVEYLKHRVQFGRPIASFQVLAHRAVDMLIQLELSRAIATYAAAAIDGDITDEPRGAVAAAKVQVTVASRFVREAAIQMHGAIGITEELPIGQYVKRLTMIEREFGAVVRGRE